MRFNIDGAGRRRFLAGLGGVLLAPAAARAAGDLHSIFIVLVRRPDLSSAALAQSFEALGKRLPADGALSRDLSQVVGETKRTDIAPQPDLQAIDAFVELTYPTLSAARDAMAGSQGRALKVWLGAVATDWSHLIVRQRVFVPIVRDAASVKVISLISRPGDWTAARFVKQWIGVHGPLSTEVPGLSGFAALEIVDRPTGAGALAHGLRGVDGVAESWSPSTASRTATLASAKGKSWYADGAASMGRIRTMLAAQTFAVG